MADIAVPFAMNVQRPERVDPIEQLVEIQPVKLRATTGVPVARDTSPSSALARLVRSERAYLGLTQERLAHLSGVSVGTIRNIERGRTVSPHRASTRRLFEVLRNRRAAQVDGRPPDDIAEARADTDRSGATDHDRLGAVVAVIPRQLPAGARHFAGRRQELSALDNLVTDAAVGPIIVVLTGPEGAGKSALALHWAHANAALFPDGQLYADLHGTSRSGMLSLSAWEVLRSFLQALDQPTDRIAVGLDHLSAYFRSVLAGKRMLLMLDDVSSVEQVRPLLPGGPGSVVLITSRRTLGHLVATEGAYELTLAGLDHADSVQLLANLLGEQRITAEGCHVSALVAGSAGLPSALTLAAACAVTRPGVSLASIAADLAREVS